MFKTLSIVLICLFLSAGKSLGQKSEVYMMAYESGKNSVTFKYGQTAQGVETRRRQHQQQARRYIELIDSAPVKFRPYNKPGRSKGTPSIFEEYMRTHSKGTVLQGTKEWQRTSKKNFCNNRLTFYRAVASAEILSLGVAFGEPTPIGEIFVGGYHAVKNSVRYGSKISLALWNRTVRLFNKKHPKRVSGRKLSDIC